MGGDVTASFSPRIAAFIDVLKRGKFGMCATTCRISDVKTGASSLTTGPCGDRFRITIPYAGYSINWYVIFNHKYPEDPPDFILTTDENFCPQIDNIKSLVDWDASDPGSLLRVIQELVVEYETWQLDVISRSSLLNFQYTSLLESEKTDHEPDNVRINKEDIEVHVIQKAVGSQSKNGPINFLIKLPVNFSKIPPYLTKDYPGEDSAVLLVTFPSDEGHTKVTPQLYLSARVEQCLGGTANLRIPGYPSGAILLDYVPDVCTLLQNKVDTIVNSYEKRKEYVGAFIAYFSRNVVEYDAESFNKVSFIMEWHDFFFIVHIVLSSAFPSEQPVLGLQSVYHQGEDGKPYYKEHTTYPYSPRWSPKQMAERARQYLLEKISSFQRESVSEGSLQ